MRELFLIRRMAEIFLELEDTMYRQKSGCSRNNFQKSRNTVDKLLLSFCISDLLKNNSKLR